MSFVRLIRNVLPHMRERGGGRILNVASSSIKQPIENLMLSNTFRAGIAGLVKSLSTELAPDGILINTLGPERIHTERSASLELAQAEARDSGRRGADRVRGEDSARPLRESGRVREGGGFSGLSDEHLHDRAGDPGRWGHGPGTVSPKP